MSRFLILFALLALTLISCSREDEDFEGHYRLALEYFPSCAEMVSYVDQRHSRQEFPSRKAEGSHGGGLGAPTPDVMSTSADGTSATGTNVQESGVDEADLVKVIDNELYIARENRIDILNATTLAPLGSLPYAFPGTLELYVDGDRLIVLERRNGGIEAKIFRRGVSPQLIFSFSGQGILMASRLKDGKLYLVIQDYFFAQGDSVYQPARVANSAAVPCQNTVRPLTDDADTRLIKVHGIDVHASSLVDQSTAILGGGDVVYQSADHLYVAKAGFQFPWRSSGESPLLVTQFSLEGGTPRPVAVGVVEGNAPNRWAFREKDGFLAITTTSIGTPAASRITVLQTDGALLKTVGKSVPFGQGESLYAVRYVDDFAYAVTFRRMDPLHVFDLSSPTAPALRGELVIPGFSQYLHPAGSGRLIGVGVGDLGGNEEITAFDVSNPADPKKTSALSVGASGTYTLAMYEPHAFFYSASPALVAVPYQNSRDDASALVARLDGNRLVETARLSHASRIPAACNLRGDDPRITRLIKVGSRLLAISGVAVTAHEMADPGPTAAAKNLDPAGGCTLGGAPSYGYYD